MNLYCHNSNMEKIKENKQAFISNMINLGIPYDVCFEMSYAKNKAINKTEEANKPDENSNSTVKEGE